MISVQLAITNKQQKSPLNGLPQGYGWGRCTMPSVPRVGEIIVLSRESYTASFTVVAVSYECEENEVSESSNPFSADRSLEPESFRCEPKEDYFAVAIWLEPTDRKRWQEVNGNRTEL
jgi:hypothetical protein